MIFVILAFFYGMWMGRSRIIALTLGIYFSYILTQAIPWKELKFLGVKNPPESMVQIFVFLALILGLYFLIPYSGLRHSLKLGSRDRAGWWQILIASIFQIGLGIEVAISFLSAKVLIDLNPFVRTIFVGETAKFIWFLLPILALMFLRSPKGRYNVD